VATHAKDAKAEIEATPEMIEAGINVLWASCIVEHPCEADKEIIPEIFIAMIRTSPSFAK
jgi:hypothetical protein